MCYFKRNRANFIHVFNCSKKKNKKNKKQKNSCYVEVEIDSKFVALLTDIEKLEKVLQLNVVPNKEKISKIKAMKTGLNILTKRSAHLN